MWQTTVCSENLRFPRYFHQYLASFPNGQDIGMKQELKDKGGITVYVEDLMEQDTAMKRNGIKNGTIRCI